MKKWRVHLFPSAIPKLPNCYYQNTHFGFIEVFTLLIFNTFIFIVSYPCFKAQILGISKTIINCGIWRV
ncbi:hypothetical protein M5689_015328 [Euphorbia peplus]|nr:hypothetical protein M5689_015328 [Euphorbia peplus]